MSQPNLGNGAVPLWPDESDPLGLHTQAREPDRHERLIPMINLVFLILTFFLIAGTIRAADPLQVEPASAQSAGTLDPRDPVLYVDAEGTIAFAGERVSLDVIVSLIKLALDGDPGATLQIKADRATKAHVILPMLAQLQAAGITSVQLVTLLKTEDP